MLMRRLVPMRLRLLLVPLWLCVWSVWLTIKALFGACVSRLWGGAWSVERGAAVECLFTLVAWCE